MVPDLRHCPLDIGGQRRVHAVDVHLQPLPPLLVGQLACRRRLHLVELGLEPVHHLFVWERRERLFVICSWPQHYVTHY